MAYPQRRRELPGSIEDAPPSTDSGPLCGIAVRRERHDSYVRRRGGLQTVSSKNGFLGSVSPFPIQTVHSCVPFFHFSRFCF